jgi:hypothetical protein
MKNAAYFDITVNRCVVMEDIEGIGRIGRVEFEGLSGFKHKRVYLTDQG